MIEAPRASTYLAAVVYNRLLFRCNRLPAVPGPERCDRRPRSRRLSPSIGEGRVPPHPQIISIARSWRCTTLDSYACTPHPRRRDPAQIRRALLGPSSGRQGTATARIGHAVGSAGHSTTSLTTGSVSGWARSHPLRMLHTQRVLKPRDIRPRNPTYGSGRIEKVQLSGLRTYNDARKLRHFRGGG